MAAFLLRVFVANLADGDWGDFIKKSFSEVF